jgi:hypothetical protein
MQTRTQKFYDCKWPSLHLFYYNQSSRWAPVFWPKSCKTLLGPVNFSVFILNYIKINSRIWFEPVNLFWRLWTVQLNIIYYLFCVGKMNPIFVYILFLVMVKKLGWDGYVMFWHFNSMPPNQRLLLLVMWCSDISTACPPTKDYCYWLWDVLTFQQHAPQPKIIVTEIEMSLIAITTTFLLKVAVVVMIVYVW